VATERTIDQLAHDEGLPASTIRLYQSRGLLPRPRIEGRVGYYGDAHVARLRLIGRLQDQGFSLAAIRHLVDAWQDQRSLDDVLGVEAAIAGTVAGGRSSGPTRTTLAALAAQFEGVDLQPDDLVKAASLGLIEVDPDDPERVRIPNPEYLRLGSEIARAGNIPPGEVLDEYAALRRSTEDIAGRFVDLFDRHVLAAVRERGYRPNDVEAATATFDRLRRLATEIVEQVLGDVLAKQADRRLAEEASRLGARRRRRG
jgi:DNA-binding transcriptional MerR regulator